MTLALLGVAGRAAALSCATPPWDYQQSSPFGFYGEGGYAVPVDARPWYIAPCYGGPPARATDCFFVDQEDGTMIPVEVEQVGGAACDVSSHELPGGTPGNVIVTFTPAEPLAPSHVYAMECGSGAGEVGELQVRGDVTPAAPPVAIEVVEARYSRDDNGCCGHGDDIQIEIDSVDHAYLREGGYIDILLGSGQRFAAGGDAQIVVPPASGIITLTPVSASGVRGEPVEVDADDLGGDLVYIPCNIAGGPSPAALWLLAPFAWIFAHGRRRRSA